MLTGRGCRRGGVLTPWWRDQWGFEVINNFWNVYKWRGNQMWEFTEWYAAFAYHLLSSPCHAICCMWLSDVNHVTDVIRGAMGGSFTPGATYILLLRVDICTCVWSCKKKSYCMRRERAALRLFMRKRVMNQE
jgi:hypothetical protein